MDKRIIISVAAAILAAAGIVLFGIFHDGSDKEKNETTRESETTAETTAALSDTETLTESATETETETETESESETETETEKAPETSDAPSAADEKAKSERYAAKMKLSEDLLGFDFEQIYETYRAHAAAYPDTRGWIYIPDTGISFPVVQGTDNDFYLDHNGEGGYYVCGAIFADYRNSKDIWSDFNTVIYGHNVWFGGMFHDIEKFLVKDFFTTHNIYIFTLDALYVYHPFTIFMADWGYKYFHPYLEEGDDWVSFAREMRDNSKFPQDIDFTKDDHILTVSTCTNGYYTERWSFQSKRTAELDYNSVRKLIPSFPHNYKDFYAADDESDRARP